MPNSNRLGFIKRHIPYRNSEARVRRKIAAKSVREDLREAEQIEKIVSSAIAKSKKQ